MIYGIHGASGNIQSLNEPPRRAPVVPNLNEGTGPDWPPPPVPAVFQGRLRSQETGRVWPSPAELFLVASCYYYSKALVTRSDALVPRSLLFISLIYPTSCSSWTELPRLRRRRTTAAGRTAEAPILRLPNPPPRGRSFSFEEHGIQT